MHERADRLAGNFVTVDDEVAREFEARLVESSTLAFRIAFSVLRHREDAEDVAQEAFAKAYRSFRQLRDRDRFRAWLVRMTCGRPLTGSEQPAAEPPVKTLSSGPPSCCRRWKPTSERNCCGVRLTPCPTSCGWSSCWRRSKGTTCERSRRCWSFRKGQSSRASSWRGSN